MVLFLLLPILAYGQAPEMISIKDYNPQKKYDKPICIVDMYGEMECKSPEKKPEPVKPTSVERPKLKPASNEAWEAQVLGIGFGSFKGLGTNLQHHSGQWSYGASLRLQMYSPPNTETQADSKLEALVAGGINYHLFPRWYSYASGHKQWDLSIGTQLGYNYVAQKDELSTRKSEPVVSFGLQASYPVFDNLRLLGGVDVYQNFSFKSIGNGGYLGVGFEF